MSMRSGARPYGPAVAGAIASAVAGVVHIGAARWHLGVSAAEVGFFGVVAIFQLGWAAAALGSPGNFLWRSGAVVNGAVMTIWFVSRTVGLPLGPHAGGLTPVGGPDLVATISEMVVLASCLLLGRSERRFAFIPRRLLIVAIAALVAMVPLQGVARQEAPGMRAPVATKSASNPPVRTPLASNMTFGYAKGRLVAFTYAQQYFCTVDPTDDLDGPGHEGDGQIAAMDPAELIVPPCILGETRHGSLPAIDPGGRDVRTAPKLYGLVPSFDSDGDQVTEDNDPTPAIQTACPQPGLPYTSVKGQFLTCTMHPGYVHAEPYVRTLVGQKTGVAFPGDVPEGDLTVGNHSHVVDVVSSPVRWWLAVVVFVHDRSIWPDFKGQCPARRGCLTSVAAIRAAQRAGQVEPDLGSNIWFDFSVRPVQL